MTRDGVGCHSPLGRPDSFGVRELSPDQLRAFRQILASTDFITLFRGGAGTGKSFVLRRVQDAVRRAGSVTQAAAPQRQQVIDLGRNGLQDVQTVAEFVLRGVLPRNAIVIVDEAGQISGQQMLDLLRLVKDANGRVILSGDTRQHGPVKASDALLAIERYAGLRPVQLDEIRRQDPDRAKRAEDRERIATYRKAVEAAAAGDIVASLGLLERIDAVKECGINEQRERLTEAYLGFAARGETAIVVSQTRAEVRAINEAVRAGLRRCGALTGADTSVTALEQIDPTAAQKADARHYLDECYIVLNREFRGCPRGSRGALVGVTSAGIVVEIGGMIRRVPQKFLDRITVCRPVPLAVSSGDRLQLKANGVAMRSERLANGEIVTVSAVLQDGSIRLHDGRTLPADYRQFQRGYAVTSYGSQGKTVDHVLFADAADRTATNAQQWYVTISRGRKSIQIYTTDREQLRQAIAQSGERELALDLANSTRRSARLRERVRQNIRRGHEFARRLCRTAMRAWVAAFLKPETQNLNETPPREQQQSVLANVLAT
jgi:ATP-dependent exoDNAse (exonuclease V) alpha subunit